MSDLSTQTRRSFRSKGRSAHEELIRTAESLPRVGQQFTEALTDAATEADTYKARIRELEAKNEDLQRGDTLRPEVARAIAALNEAERNIKQQKRRLQDLLEERRPGLASTPSYRPSLLLEDIHTPTRDNSDLGSTSSSPVTRRTRPERPSNISTTTISSTKSTIRPRILGLSQSTPGPSSLPLPSQPVFASSPRSSLRSTRTNSGRHRKVAETTKAPSSSGQKSDPSLNTSIHVQVPLEQDDEVWQLSASRPPLSSEVLSRPMSWIELQARLEFDDETIYSLECLSGMDDLCLRIQIVEDIAFVYDPFTMDGPSASMLMDWGSETANAETVMYIIERIPANSVMHIFTLPRKKNLWYYIGAHTWDIVNDFWPVWPTLGDPSKGVVIAKLRNRCNHQKTQEELVQMMDDGRLEQLCIKISSKDLKATSRAFMSKLGFTRDV
ncbi:hypothetical protein BJ138DRAFT_1177355 [Hygrophoropsis aurantiaca]|uniref:Uncharacterized protein n=1 Tax=Hygrophoropsis aurantiaca TaxID=72124 RepID=A0ACB8AMM4_9AGAM|nr:hypothetical protein BJ138DRAFT_1177355 [Hygrophoropsis aurantiaca]